MIGRNTIVGIDFLVLGFALAGLGYILALSISIAAIGVDVAILGALILLIVPEPIPQDAYRALLGDSISNIELILEESRLEERAYFIPTREKHQIRAFVPATSKQRETLVSGSSSKLELIEAASKALSRFVSNYGNQLGLLLVPPGNEIVRLSKVQEGDDLEDSLRLTIVSFSDLASSVMAVEEQNGANSIVKINITDPKISSEFPFFNRCLGSPLSCIASCVVAVAKGRPVRLIDETLEGNLIHTTLEIIR